MDEQQKEILLEQPKSHNVRLFFLVFLFTFLLAFGFYKFGNFFPGELFNVSNQSPTNTAKVTPTPTWKKPASTQKGFPILSTGQGETKRNFVVYNFTTKQTKTAFSNSWGGGAVGLGSNDPLPSPDLLYTAFIDDQKKNLWLMSNETFERKQITQHGNVEYISGWSPNSKMILYYIPAETISTRTENQMGIPTGTVKFEPVRESGFFIFNTETGKTTLLYPVEFVEGFIDNDHLLVRTKEGNYYNNRLLTFNINTFMVDYALTEEEFGFGTGQFDIAKDGKNWTFMHSQNPTNDASIIFAPFPEKEGVIIDSGSWADVQFPSLSPSGKKVAYGKRSGYAEPGIPNFNVWVYDSTTKTKKEYQVEGWVRAWVDEDLVVVQASNAPKQKEYTKLLNLKTGQTTNMY